MARPVSEKLRDLTNWVRKNSESEWGLPKRNGLIAKCRTKLKALSCTPKVAYIAYLNRVRKNSESEWELPKRNGLVAKWNYICGIITSRLVL